VLEQPVDTLPRANLGGAFSFYRVYKTFSEPAPCWNNQKTRCRVPIWAGLLRGTKKFSEYSDPPLTNFVKLVILPEPGKMPG
jgi:hypothetical protein